jgi:hypothetical protein
MMKIAPTNTAITNSTGMGRSRIELGDCHYSLRNSLATLGRNCHYLSVRGKCGAAYIDFMRVGNLSAATIPGVGNCEGLFSTPFAACVMVG